MRFQISNLNVEVNGKKIVENINLLINKGEIHLLMGPNGSGKSSLSLALMGHPDYKITNGDVFMDKLNIKDLSPSKKAFNGLFLAFQKPPAIPGVSVFDFLKTAYSEIHCKDKKTNCSKCSVRDFHEIVKKIASDLKIDESFLKRGVNQDFSGGEVKKMEILQLFVLKPKIAILDEIDAGLDIDALKVVSKNILELNKQGVSFLVITHNPKLTEYIKPDFAHIMVKGKILKSGTKEVIEKILKNGYENFN